MLAKPGWWIILAVFAAVVALCAYRDIRIERQYTADLRNRVVGARLEKEHRSPYLYSWHPGDAIAYYDPSNIAGAGNTAHVSNITATPFFHHLMAPLAGLPQRTVSRIWLLVEYLLLSISVGIALLLTANRPQRIMVLAVIALFLLSEAWKNHIATGQNYLPIPCLALLFYFFFRHRNKLWYGAAAGLCAILLVLIRPNALIFFIPFLLVIRQYSWRYWMAFFLPVAVLAGWSLGNREERSLWLDYKELLARSVVMHQRDTTHDTPPVALVSIDDWEGWRQKEIDSNYAQYPYTGHSEHGNVFVLFEKIFHRKTNVLILNLASAAVLLSLAGLFLWAHRGESGYDLLQIAVFGFCLYMISDLFSPIWRFQYNTAQWLCPLLLVTAAWKPAQKNMFVLLLLLAMILSIVNIPVVKMEHTMGEYLLLGVMLYLSLAGSHTLKSES